MGSTPLGMLLVAAAQAQAALSEQVHNSHTCRLQHVACAQLQMNYWERGIVDCAVCGQLAGVCPLLVNRKKGNERCGSAEHMQSLCSVSCTSRGTQHCWQSKQGLWAAPFAASRGHGSSVAKGADSIRTLLSFRLLSLSSLNKCIVKLLGCIFVSLATWRCFDCDSWDTATLVNLISEYHV